MKQAFELIINKDEILKEDFLAFYNTLSSYINTFETIRFHILLSDGKVRYAVESNKDLSSISNGVDFAIIKPIDSSEVFVPDGAKKERFMNFVTGGTLLDLREKVAVKRGKKLDHFVCDVKRITSTKAKVNIKLYFKDAAGQWSVASKVATQFPAHLFAFNFKTANTYMKAETPKYLNIEKSLHLFIPENANSILEVDTFPYFPKPYYLNLPSFEFDKHSLIVGASGSGKSKFIQLFIDRLQRLPNSYDYRVLVIDPHASLANNLQNINNSKIIDFNSSSTQLFASSESDITAATELTSTLLKDLIGDGYNPRTERVVRFTLYVLFSVQKMSLGKLKLFLTELDTRQEILNEVEGSIPHNISHFFATEFNEIRSAFYNESILPIVSIVDELELQPALLGEDGIPLQTSLQDNFLTVFSLNKVSMGEKSVKTVAGLLIQQIFLLAQSRTFGQKILLFIDEVSVVQNPALSAILSEARKYNLFVFLTQQYMSQVNDSLQDSIYANVTNYYCFRVSEDDAQKISNNLPMELQKDMLIDAKSKGISEQTIKVRMLTDLDPRDCIIRVAAGGKILPSFKARTLDIGDADQVITVETKMEKDFVADAYKGKIESLENFLDRADKLPAGIPITIPVQKQTKQTESAVRDPDPPAPPGPQIGIEPIQAPHGPTSLDELMNQTSSKDNR